MRIFVYGTLQSHALCQAVAGGVPITQTPAEISGYAVLPVAGNVVPLIRAQDGAVTKGALLDGITPDQVTRLDTYEGAFGYQLIDVMVQTSDGPVNAKMYLPPADIAVGAGDWSFADWQENCEATAVIAATDLLAHVPALTKEQIARNWHMIELRAWAKSTAATGAEPATVRMDPARQDYEVKELSPPLGSFFRLQQLRIQHRQFDGSTSAILDRETFVGTDAAIVLPYDPVRDRVLLVEQIRMGPLVRGSRNPWSLEPIAGMVDAFETPRTAALRETCEEAALTDINLLHVSSFYPSPGSSTDYFHAYLGVCDLPDGHATTGGLASEAEDLRLHVLPFTTAMELVQTGEINVGPLVMLLYALSAQRDALRADA